MAQWLLDNELFEVSSSAIEALDEIAATTGALSRAEVLQQAITLLYMLNRERVEHGARTMLMYGPQYPACEVQFWRSAPDLVEPCAEWSHYTQPIARHEVHYRCTQLSPWFSPVSANDEVCA